MSTIKSSSEHLTLNADGANNDIIFQSNGSNVATLDQAGLLTATSFAGSSTFTANSSSSGDYVRMYGSSGTGKWDIYGNGANLRFSDNDSAGSIVFDRQINASGGVAIGGTGAANALDDYEEGTWTPTVTFGSGSEGITATTATYTKIGRVVHIVCQFSFQNTGSPSGTAQINGLPYPIGGAFYNWLGAWNNLGTATSDTFYLRGIATLSVLNIYRQDNSTTRAGDPGTYFNGADGPILGFNLTYIV